MHRIRKIKNQQHTLNIAIVAKWLPHDKDKATETYSKCNDNGKKLRKHQHTVIPRLNVCNAIKNTKMTDTLEMDQMESEREKYSKC